MPWIIFLFGLVLGLSCSYWSDRSTFVNFFCQHSVKVTYLWSLEWIGFTFVTLTVYIPGVRFQTVVIQLLFIISYTCETWKYACTTTCPIVLGEIPTNRTAVKSHNNFFFRIPPTTPQFFNIFFVYVHFFVYISTGIVLNVLNL